MTIPNPIALVDHLRSLDKETEWVEFKLNKFDPERVGECVSALSNSAALVGKPYAYFVFGIDDRSHAAIGSGIKLSMEKVGNEEFQNWLERLLDPHVLIEILDFEYAQGIDVSLMQIEQAYQRPVRFKSHSYIRVGSITKNLKDYPERERAIWGATDRFGFEKGVARSHASKQEIFETLDVERFFKRLEPMVTSRSAMIENLIVRGLIVDNLQGGFDVSNLFALIAAKDLSNFPSVEHKAPRVVEYKGKDRLNGVEERTGRFGYNRSLPRIFDYVKSKIPKEEEMRHGIRVTEYAYPDEALRELIANALIHQDLTNGTAAPKIELFEDRIEITNAGEPLVPVDRFIDSPSKTRNQELAKNMRALGLCEERGSGVDRALAAIEARAMPAPLFVEAPGATVVTIYAERTFAGMTKDERRRACYQHACLRHQSGDPMSNRSLRKRFGLKDGQYPQVSEVIRDAIDAKLIVPLDPAQSNRKAQYIPWWAGS